LIDVVLELVARVDLFLDSLILLGELLGVLDHLVDFLLGKSSLVVGDCDGLLLSSSLIVGTDGKDGVLINFESNLNLWNTFWCWWDAIKVEFSKVVVVLGESSLTLEDGD